MLIELDEGLNMEISSKKEYSLHQGINWLRTEIRIIDSLHHLRLIKVIGRYIPHKFLQTSQPVILPSDFNFSILYLYNYWWECTNIIPLPHFLILNCTKGSPWNFYTQQFNLKKKFRNNRKVFFTMNRHYFNWLLFYPLRLIFQTLIPWEVVQKNFRFFKLNYLQ